MFTNIFICVLLLVLWVLVGFITQVLYALHYRNEPTALWYKITTAAINAALYIANRWSK